MRRYARQRSFLAQQEMLTGTIHSLRPEKGFGFIRPDDRGADVFFHRSAFRGEFTALQEGGRVTYEVDDRAERPRASHVALSGQRSGPPRGRREPFAPRGKRPTERASRSEQMRDLRPKGKTCQRGFVTKLHYDQTHGFISADSGGTEIRFEPSVVVGEKRYIDLRIGDYVEFAIKTETVGTKCPEADYVREIERTQTFPQTQLSRHPKARRKKPSWR